MKNKTAEESSTDCRTDEGVAVQMIDSIIGAVRVLRRHYEENLEDASVKEALADLAQDEDLAWLLEASVKVDRNLDESEEADEDVEEELDNEAQSGTTQPTYIDESGKVFTATDIVNGYKPKGSYKSHSISDRVSSEEFGKTK